MITMITLLVKQAHVSHSVVVRLRRWRLRDLLRLASSLLRLLIALVGADTATPTSYLSVMRLKPARRTDTLGPRKEGCCTTEA